MTYIVLKAPLNVLTIIYWKLPKAVMLSLVDFYAIVIVCKVIVSVIRSFLRSLWV